MARNEGNAIIQAQAKHYMRYLRSTEGESAEEIARTEGVSVKAIEKSIKQIQLHRAVNTQGNMNSAVISMLLGNLGRVDKGFKDLFGAKRYIERTLPDGSTDLVGVIDNDTRLEAIKTYGKFIDALQPKGGGVNLSVNQTNQTAHVTNVRHGGFVERMTEIKKRVQEHNLLPPVTVDAREEDPDDEEDDVIEGDTE